MNKSIFSKIYLQILAFFVIAAISVSWLQKPAELKNGFWRATITRTDGHEIVFNFLSKDSAGKKVIYIINGEEHLLVDSIETRADSVFIQLPFFESGFKARITEQGNLEGEWIKHYGERILRLPFKAEFDNDKRFEVSQDPVANITGSWVSTFVNKGRKSTYAAEFKQARIKGHRNISGPDRRFSFSARSCKRR